MTHTSCWFRGLLLSLLLFAPVRRMSAAEPDPSRPIELQVDATEAPRHLFRAELTIPAKPGPMTLVYPKWIPGEHAPNGPINDLSGLKIKAGDNTLLWQRDDVDLYAFHITVPDGADTIHVSLECLVPGTKGRAFGGLPSTPNLAMILWYTLVLYPQGQPVHDIPVHARLRVPDGWKVGTALPIEAESGATTTFQTVSLETLVDSPALCGRFFKEIPLGTKDSAAHSLVIACDCAEGLNASPEVVDQCQRLVAEAHALFGARHYRSYRFLMSLSDQNPRNGIEHHESSDDRLPERFFLDEKFRKQGTADLLSHEYAHSWNGKYRRPDGLATPDYQRPMQTRLLWVYEGLTQYLGFVLAGRSGMFTPELAQDHFADLAERAKLRAAQPWRPLVDTAVTAPFLYGASNDWESRRRGVDFYGDGALVWLDADTLIREKTAGKKSLDDFCKAFHGGADGPPEVKPYTFDDVVTTLNGVVPYDWKAFFDNRLNTAGEAPLDGLTRGGWQLVYSDKPSEMAKADGEKNLDLRSSLGFAIKEDGPISDVVPGSPADKAAIGPGVKLLAVNDRRFTSERLKDAVAATKGGAGKTTLLLEDGEYFHTAVLQYDGGLRYPHLERIQATPDRLSDILKSTTTAAK